MEELKQLVKQYNEAYEASKMLPSLKARIIPAIKAQQLEKIKFNFNDHSISYHTYVDHDGLSQKLIKDTLTKYYPHINKEEFMGRLLASRKQKKVETLQVNQKKNKVKGYNGPKRGRKKNQESLRGQGFEPGRS
jgi:hypothetical protein